MAHQPTKKELENILKKYLDGTATPEEITFLKQYYDYLETQPGLSALLSEAENKKIERRNWEQLNYQIDQASHSISPRQIPLYRKWRWAAAASIILALGLSGWF